MKKSAWLILCVVSGLLFFTKTPLFRLGTGVLDDYM